MFGAFFFTQSVVGAWNMLSGVVVEADMLVAFKRLLDRHVDMRGMEGFG